MLYCASLRKWRLRIINKGFTSHFDGKGMGLIRYMCNLHRLGIYDATEGLFTTVEFAERENMSHSSFQMYTDVLSHYTDNTLKSYKGFEGF